MATSNCTFHAKWQVQATCTDRAGACGILTNPRSLIPTPQVQSSPFHKWSPTTLRHATPPTNYTSFFLLQPLPPIFPGQPLTVFKTSTRCAVELHSRALLFWLPAICISHCDEGSRLNWENERAEETGTRAHPSQTPLKSFVRLHRVW